MIMEWYYVSGLTLLAQSIIVGIIWTCHTIYYKIDSWRNPSTEFDEIAQEYEQRWLNLQEKLADFDRESFAESQEFQD